MNTQKEKNWGNLEEDAQIILSMKGLKVLLKKERGEGKSEALKRVSEIIEETPIYKKNLDLKDILKFKKELLAEINKEKIK